ncbi:DUF2309 domain-containing protein [Hahella sp. SMD15-11]|uniref:Probable inorganic carbon transporter subunit DabA n=1 Tax=Thermohahella caldifontis TaxID=3142973 RepID=A0AB39UU35_9GAMM
MSDHTRNPRLATHRHGLPPQAEEALRRVCERVAPIWPLHQAIAVNPYWGRIDMPLRKVAARLAVLGNIRVFPPRDQIRRAWDTHQIHTQDLDAALTRLDAQGHTVPDAQTCIQALRHPPRVTHLPLLIDLLDNAPERNRRLTWRYAITFQISQTCAAYFDTHQSDWHSPGRQAGLYRFWRDTLRHDHGIGALIGLPRLGEALHALPETLEDAECWVAEHVRLPETVMEDYLEAVLLTVNGWASWCAGLRWRARLRHEDDHHLRELLAVRLAWGALLLECCDDDAINREREILHKAWHEAPQRLAWAESELQVDEIWQLALDISFQRQLTRRLVPMPQISAPERPEIQAAFCIDVRSEPIRRALENVWPGIRTLGVAGFFGLPARYHPLGTAAQYDILPGLLAPTADITDQCVPGPDAPGTHRDPTRLQTARQRRLSISALWDDASRWPGTAFSYAENAGFLRLVQLWQWVFPPDQPRETVHQAGLTSGERHAWRPRIVNLSREEKARLAEGLLRSLGLTEGLAPLILLIGHGSQSANNPHAAALECGACGGHSGEVNARAMAAVLNDAEVRKCLQTAGLEIPEETWFMAALHNTTTDELEAFDTDLLPAAAAARWQRFQEVWAHASDQVRRKRASGLGVDPRLPAPALLRQLRRRANDGAQLVHEWGLANNAAFIIAPGSRTRNSDLEGRVFLHDYQPDSDPDGTILETILTGPLLVTHWINWQYHASTCDPEHLGSGNKLLHNVVGGGIGVFEGNGGDLRIGLPRQSVYTRDDWRHQPVRLTVLIDARRETIDSILSRHEILRHLLEHDWIHLWRLTTAGYESRLRSGWSDVIL